MAQACSSWRRHLWMSTSVTASAVPPNMRPVPEQVTKTIDSVVPPAPHPRLKTIPDRAKAPGYPHSVQGVAGGDPAVAGG